ncbi:MAG TPA: hypothetical protein VNH84_06655, partial [Candidatus Saccharimonadales bacterium]|nr:hypothetical protein [Candidatus Saccharimonadales bacterium]
MSGSFGAPRQQVFLSQSSPVAFKFHVNIDSSIVLKPLPTIGYAALLIVGGVLAQTRSRYLERASRNIVIN